MLFFCFCNSYVRTDFFQLNDLPNVPPGADWFLHNYVFSKIFLPSWHFKLKLVPEYGMSESELLRHSWTEKVETMINKIYTEEIFKFFTSDINAYISLTAGISLESEWR